MILRAFYRTLLCSLLVSFFTISRALAADVYTGQVKAIATDKSRDYCVIDINDYVHCWADENTPVPPRDLGKVKAIAVGTFAGAIQMDDTLRCWGTPNMNDGSVFVPRQLKKARSISTDYWGEACGISLEGVAYCWHVYDADDHLPPNQYHHYDYEVRRLPPMYENYNQISITQNGACLTDVTGRADCWVESVDSLLLMPPTSNIKKISMDDWETGCALTFAGTVKCFGANYDAIYTTPEEGVEDIPTGLGKARDMSVGRFGACAVAEDGKIVCWLFADYGDIPFKSPPFVKAISVTTGFFNACAILENQKVECWGEPGRLTGVKK